MKKSSKALLILGGTVSALAFGGALILLNKYASRMTTIKSIKQLSDYSDGYNLYKMDVDYDYSIDRIIERGIDDDDSMIAAYMKEALPYLHANYKAPDFGCSAFCAIEEKGKVHMGRNYDFKNDTSAMIVRCNPSDGYRSIAVAALDNAYANNPILNYKTKLSALVSPFICLDGLNEKGVSIAILTLDSDPTHQRTGKPTISTTLAVRLVLDRAKTTSEAVRLLESYDMFASSGRDYHFYINDSSGDGRIVEYDCEREDRKLVATPISAITNFYGMYKDKVCSNQKNGIYGHGKERYDAVLNVLDKAGEGVTEESVWEALKASSQDLNPDSITSNTQWSIDYNNSDLCGRIALRRNWQDTVKFELRK